MWANTDPTSYHHFVEYPLWFNDLVGFHYERWATSVGRGAGEPFRLRRADPDDPLLRQRHPDGLLLRHRRQGGLGGRHPRERRAEGQEGRDAADRHPGRDGGPRRRLSRAGGDPGLGRLRRRASRLGDPHRDRHRVLLPRGAHRVRRGPPGRAVPAAPGHRRRRGGARHPRGVLPRGGSGAGVAAAFGVRLGGGVRAGELAAAPSRPGRPAPPPLDLGAQHPVVLALPAGRRPELVRLRAGGAAPRAGAAADRAHHPACRPRLRPLRGGRAVPHGPPEPHRAPPQAPRGGDPVLLRAPERGRRVQRYRRSHLARDWRGC